MLEAVQLSRKAGAQRLLDDISLTLAAGQRLALVGPSGSGKTLLLRSLALLDPSDTGTVHWQGHAVPAHDVPRFRSRVIYLHQRPAFLDGTVERILRQPFQLRVHRDKKFDRSRIVRMLESLGRTDAFLSKQQRDLSGGETQLTALLRAVQMGPDILLLDEPTANLDAAATEMVESFVARWLDQRHAVRAMIWVTHNHQQANRIATSVLDMHAGRLTGVA